MSMFTQFKSDFQSRTQVVFSLEDYLERAKTDKSLYMSPPERLIKAIGEPTTIDTAQDPRLSRIFQNKIIRVYPAFKDFYGLEDTIFSLVFTPCGARTGGTKTNFIFIRTSWGRQVLNC